MKEYLRDRKKKSETATVTGVVLTLSVHVVALLFCNFTGMKYLYPPPQEQTFLIDFEEEEQPVIRRQYYGRTPQAETVDKEKPVNLIQKSESPHQSLAENKTAEGRPDDFGDVETLVQKEEEIDKNSLFPGMSKKDSSLAPHAASDPKDEFKAGHPEGNTSTGKTDSAPNARLKGRNVLGALPRPAYTVQDEGTVVVDIWVDNYGNVTKAVPGAKGTTVSNQSLWAAARAAAMKAHFNQNADAPALQQGTITYIFKLK
ncbi:MAG: TonB family protein [Candidatus Cryptobacteroides sp.]